MRWRGWGCAGGTAACLALFALAMRRGDVAGSVRRRGVWLLQEDLSLLALEQRRSQARLKTRQIADGMEKGQEQMLAKAVERAKRQIKSDVATGSVGMGIGGSHPLPPPPPPTWARGGHSWIYTEQYGDGVRPTDSVWCDCDTLQECKAKCGKAEEPEVEPADVTSPAPEPEAAEADAAGAAEDDGPAEQVRSAEQDVSHEDEPFPASPPAASEAAVEAAEPVNNGGGAGFILTAPWEGYAPKLPAGGRGLPYGGISPFHLVPAPAPVALPADGEGDVGYVHPQEYGYEPTTVADASSDGLLPANWVDEDAAQHALTLAQWRVNILKSRLHQANLNKQLLAASSPEVAEENGRAGPASQKEERGDDRDDQDKKILKEGEGLGEKMAAQAHAVAGLKDDLAAIAGDTAQALGQLRRSFAALKRHRGTMGQDGAGRPRLAQDAAGSGSRAAGTSEMTGGGGQDRWSKLKEVQRATHAILQGLEDVVSKIAARKASLRQELWTPSTVVSRELSGSVQGVLGGGKRGRGVRRAALGGARDVAPGAAAKAARILRVKRRADRQLDSLLAQVKGEMQRKEAAMQRRQRKKERGKYGKQARMGYLGA